MYADDTVILAEPAQELQLALDAHNHYCKTWELTVNVSKTKVMVSHEVNVTTANYIWRPFRNC